MPAAEVAEENTSTSGVERRSCGLATGWRGDDQCILAPEPSQGFQLHFGPANHDDPEEIARYTLAPGAEAMLCTYIVTPNDDEIYYTDWQNKLRPGSHHLVVNQVADGEEMAGVPCGMGDGASGKGWLEATRPRSCRCARSRPRMRELRARFLPTSV